MITQRSRRWAGAARAGRRCRREEKAMRMAWGW